MTVKVKLPVDDLLLLVSDELDDVPGHAQWHTIDLDAGPYRIEGELSTMPGFDPGRALARPSGQFVLLRDVRITLLSEPTGGDVRCAHALVNRYTVDRIAAALGKEFPLAHLRALVPPERLLIETDSPFLSPPGAPRKRNEPEWVAVTARWLAERRPDGARAPRHRARSPDRAPR